MIRSIRKIGILRQRLEWTFILRKFLQAWSFYWELDGRNQATRNDEKWLPLPRVVKIVPKFWKVRTVKTSIQQSKQYKSWNFSLFPAVNHSLETETEEIRPVVTEEYEFERRDRWTIVAPSKKS